MTLPRRDFIGAGVAGAAATGALSADARSEKSKSLYAMGSRRELFVDDFLVESMCGKVTFQLHHPIAQEQVVQHSHPWEGVGSGYHTVLQDGGTYRLYYRGLNFKLINGPHLPHSNQEVTCYAESRDGIHWVKPKLGLFAHDGSKQNNIVWQGGGCHNFSPFIDRRPGCPAGERLKAFGGVKRDGGMLLFQSADGIHWKRVGDRPVITHGYFDSANVGFWDPSIGRYRAYWRFFTAAEIRAIRTAVSDDLMTWRDEHDLVYPDAPEQHMYTNHVLPYFRAPHLLLGFPMRYVERGWNPSMRFLPDLRNRKVRLAAHPRYATALTETQLMASRDGVAFKLWNEAFLPPGIQRPDSWYYGHNAVAWNMVTTQAPLAGAPDELSFYATSGEWHGAGTKLTRYTLRQDGFVSATAPYAGGELVTRPLTFQGARLEINFATSAAGTLQVELQTPSGQPIKGFALEDADETFGNELSRTVTWRGTADLSRLAGVPIRLRFALSDTDLYAIRFS